jgi:peptidoglycan/LPS O-acetylase OafA/YrhL
MLFFALSGFLISWPFWKQKFAQAEQVVSPGYTRRRFWKIYPPLALSVVFFTPIYIRLYQDWSYIPLAAKWLVGIPLLFPVSGKLNGVMWTLVVEVQFYIVLPILFVAFKKLSPKVCLLIISLIFMVVPTVMRVSTGKSATIHPDINTHFPSALVAGLENMGVLKKGWAKLGIAGLVLWPIALAATAWINTHSGSYGRMPREVVRWMEIIASGCLLCYVANPQHLVARLLCAPWLRWCGIISYEWYLFHQPIMLWTRDAFGPAHGVVAKYIAMMGGSFLVGLTLAASIYQYFSLPILKFGRTQKKKAAVASNGRLHF